MSNHLYNNIRIGDTMVTLPPAGNFKFKPENSKRHIVLIGDGSGITPLFSIIKTVLIKEPASAVSLIYVNSNKENTIYYQQLGQWHSEFSSRLRIVYYWSDVVKNNQSKAGFWTRLFKRIDTNAPRINPITLKVIFKDLLFNDGTNTEFYICDPEVLMEMATSTIQGLEFSKEVIHKESFYTVTKKKNAPADD